MNVHHEELLTQFEILFGVQNELKESLNLVESNWQNKKEFFCFTEIDQWEQEVINRIKQVAANARKTANDIMVKELSDIRHRLSQVDFDMKQQQQQGHYLDNDIAELRNKLEKLNTTIQNANEKIRINYSATNKIDWNSLLYVTINRTSMGENIRHNHLDLSDFVHQGETTPEKIWKNIRKFIKHKHSNIDLNYQKSSYKLHTSAIYEPIMLTSVDSFTGFSSRSISRNSSTSIGSDDQQPSDYIFLRSMNHNRILPQGSDA